MLQLMETPEWQALLAHKKQLDGAHMRDWFSKEKNRFLNNSLNFNEILLDYSRNLMTDQTLPLLIQLAERTQLKEKIKQLFTGGPINTTEKRPALHTILRAQNADEVRTENQSIYAEVEAVREKTREFSAQIHAQKWLGVTGKPIQFIVNIGIGGSHHGPMLSTLALKDFAISSLSFHFISTVDQAHLNDVLEKIDIEQTLFIVSSKSFTTIETLTNTQTILQLLQQKLSQPLASIIEKHMIAITAKPEKAQTFGIPLQNIFTIWDWVGGRYSVWSAIGLPLMLMIGAEQFDAFLAGANAMDKHFQTAVFSANMPVLLALLSVWYQNFYHAQAQAIVPYSHRLRHFITYLQQAEMESNGKSVNLQGETVPYATSPVIFGGEGCDGQHTYHQLLHQGKPFIPVDFILIAEADKHIQKKHHHILIASALSQAEALMRGKTQEEAEHELLHRQYHPTEAKTLSYHKVIPGNRPSNVILLKRLTPFNLGALLALYEHKIFVQGAIWNINSFDQWGVELGKELLPAILKQLENPDSANSGFIQYYQQLRTTA